MQESQRVCWDDVWGERKGRRMKSVGLVGDCCVRLRPLRFVAGRCFPISKVYLMLETCSIDVCSISITPPAPEPLLHVRDTPVQGGMDALLHQG